MLLKDLTKNSTSIGMAVNASNATVASNQATLNNAAGVTSSSSDVRVTTRRVTWLTQKFALHVSLVKYWELRVTHVYKK